MKHIIPFVALLIAAACGGSGSPLCPGPTCPSSGPVITTPATVVSIGQAVQFTATGTGTIQWGGDAPAVATISASGLVTGIATGRVTIWAENEGGRATRLLRVVPSYIGTWQGSYTIQDCQETGDFAADHFCDDFTQGLSLYTRYDLSQTDDRVTGTLTLGTLVASFNPAVITEDGALPVAGTFTGGTTTLKVENGRLECPASGSMSGGQFEQSWQDTTYRGQARLVCRIDGLTRTSTGPSLFQQPSGQALKVGEVIRRVLRR